MTRSEKKNHDDQIPTAPTVICEPTPSAAASRPFDCYCLRIEMQLHVYTDEDANKRQ